jgi:serine/threonine-protein kinase
MPVSGSQPSAPIAVPEGARPFGRYTLLKRLGHGGMAEVHLARVTGEAGFERLVALKLINPQMAADPLLVEHFLDEARLAARLSHPNIVQITDLGRADDQYFIAMEYVEGADLLHLIQLAERRGQPIPPGIALRIVTQVCAGLHAAHTAVGPDGRALELVHRDVKSANVFVARNGAVKVGDFGIAKASEAYRVRKTAAGQAKGTPAYMAPEHRLGHAVDQRSDEYGVGAVAYELLATRVIDLDLTRLVMLGREGWPHLPKLAEVRPELPVELDAIVFRALAFDAEARFSDCAQLQDALEAVATQQRWVENDRAVGKWVQESLAWELAVTDVSGDGG